MSIIDELQVGLVECTILELNILKKANKNCADKILSVRYMAEMFLNEVIELGVDLETNGGLIDHLLNQVHEAIIYIKNIKSI
jgi:predicted transcriptional regulator